MKRISIMLPSRGRPQVLRRMIQSVIDTADDPRQVEVIVRLDDDDPAHQDYWDSMIIDMDIYVRVRIGPRGVLSTLWNDCVRDATGDIFMHAGDDIIFRSPGWDTRVIDHFNRYQDKILLVYGRDGFQDQNMSTHGFISRRWTEVVGYFLPPLFSSDYNDAWLFEVAGMLNRRIYDPTIYTEHMHPVAGKGPLDITHQERLERHKLDDCDKLWRETAHARAVDASKLRAVMV